MKELEYFARNREYFARKVPSRTVNHKMYFKMQRTLMQYLAGQELLFNYIQLYI